MAVPGGILPFGEFVLKVHSRCDLACDHCYVYEHADQSWRRRPAAIAQVTVAKAAERIAEHARVHRLSDVRVILHGGEPLLVGLDGLARITRTLRAAIEPVCRLDLRIHTNGVQLNEKYCELFVAEQVKVGISLDGDRAANDRHRRYADGRSSYDRALDAIGLLRRRFQQIYAGLLATVDISNDPVATYRALAALEPPNLDFLLPHGTWDTPPPGTGLQEVTPYGEWLAVIFDEWMRDGRRPPIRIFDSIIATSRGGDSTTESLGLASAALVVIETDGTIEQADSIKVAYDGAPATGLDIFSNRLDDAADHPAIRARQSGLAGLCTTCQRYPVVTSCGGGLYAHRYRSVSGFLNPSVYCGDLKKIITHVRAGSAEDSQLSQPDLAHFDALASGYGGPEAIAYLRSYQREERHRLLGLLRKYASRRGDHAFVADLDLLLHPQRSMLAAVDDVLEHPYVRAWAERSLRALHDGQAADVGYLGSILAVAAIRRGAKTELGVLTQAGHAHLPTLGRLRVGNVEKATVTITGDGGFQVRAASRVWQVGPGAESGSDDWEATRTLHAGDFVVRLEDTDSYRDVHEYPPAARLTDAEAAAWQQQFASAWSLIAKIYPHYAVGIVSGLRSLMPLANDLPREISATASEAFGAVAAARPASGDKLALLIMHEFQHVKLGALMDMFDLVDPNDQRLFYAPWRADPRPPGALLQGTYAHLTVADYWRSYRHLAAPGSARLEAAELFARWRTLTAEAIDTLVASGALTSLGMRFVEGMRATVEPWLDEPVPPGAAEAAHQWAAERRAEWKRQEGRWIGRCGARTT
jgi:uncharacterized protein